MTVTAITPQKRRPNRRSVFIDGAFAFGLDQDALARTGLAPGMTLSQKQLDALLSQLVYENARDTALRYLGYRARSRHETLKRLEADEYPATVIARVMALMEKYHYIDDAQFAADYVASRMRSGRYGARRIRQELKQKGVDSVIIEEAFAHAQTEGGETNAALKWLCRRRPDMRQAGQRLEAAYKRKLSEALARRGFGWDAIKEAMTVYEGGLDDED